MDKIRGKRQKVGLIEDSWLIDKEEFNKMMENFINNIGHLNGMIPEDQIWASVKDETEKHLQ